MKLKDFEPSAKIYATFSDSKKSFYNHFIELDESPNSYEPFCNELLLILLKDYEGIRDEVEEHYGLFDLMNMEIEIILKSIKDRPYIFSYSNDGDNFGFEGFINYKFIQDGNLENMHYLLFEEDEDSKNLLYKSGYLKVISN